MAPNFRKAGNRPVEPLEESDLTDEVNPEAIDTTLRKLEKKELEVSRLRKKLKEAQAIIQFQNKLLQRLKAFSSVTINYKGKDERGCW